VIPPRLHPRVARIAAVAIVLLGAVLRLRQYLTVRSLWLDEASLSLNIASRSYAGLTKPLDLAQVAPIPYLWVERLFCDLFGVNELALRAPALLAGIALPWVVWRVAREVLDDVPALIATALVAVAPTLIYYSNEVKPYGIDALATAVLTWLVLRVIEQPTHHARWFALMVGGSLGVALSFPTVLVFPAAMLALLLSGEVRRSLRFQWLMAGTGVFWAITFAISYGSVQTAASSSYLRHFWDGLFFKLGDSGRLWTGLSEALQQILVGSPDIPQRKAQVVVLLCLCLIGSVSLIRRQRAWAAMLFALPLVTVFAAAVLHRYPFVARTVLFTSPMLLVLIAAAVSAIAPARTSVGLALSVLLLVPGVFTDALRFAQPKRREDSRPVYQQLEEKRAIGEPIYIYVRAIPAWAIYSTDWTAPDRDRLAFISTAATDGGPSFENAPPRGHLIEREGDELIWKGNRGPELLGLATGVSLRPNTPPVRKTPDEGWAQNEVRRLNATGSQTAWLFFSHVADDAERQLLETLTGSGGAVLQVIRTDDVVAYRVLLGRERRAEGSNLTP
jgi:hypothetical protein